MRPDFTTLRTIHALTPRQARWSGVALILLAGGVASVLLGRRMGQVGQ